VINDRLDLITTSTNASRPARVVGRVFVEPMPRARAPWLATGREPTLAEILSDPLTGLVMAADGVDPEELATTLSEIGQKLVNQCEVIS
jgi:hypothetical protein